MIDPDDKAAFSELMGRLGIAFNRETTRPVMLVYWNALCDLPLSAVLEGAERVIRVDTWFPTPARLREAATPAPGVPAARAARVFERLLHGAPCYDPHLGAYWTSAAVENAYGAVAREAFEAAGGMQAFRTRTDREVPFLRKAFVEAWAPAEEAERQGLLPAKHAPALPANDRGMHALVADLADAKAMPGPRRLRPGRAA